MKEFKISSLHDDLYVPKATQHLGEYKDYPERFNPEELSVINRLEQFGVDVPLAEKKYAKKIKSLSWDEYNGLLAEVLALRYDVIVASVFDRYMFPSQELAPSDEMRMKEMGDVVRKYEKLSGFPGINLIKSGQDFNESGNLVLGLEAGAHLIKNITDLKTVLDDDIKLFGLQYGADNNLATNKGGLTVLGRQVVNYLFDHNIVIDLAHSSKKTRGDVLAISLELVKGNLVSYTHGSIQEDIIDSWQNKFGERALASDEAERIIKAGGIIGLGVSQPFFENTRKLAERIVKIAQIDGGVNKVAIGTDFGGVPPAWLKEIKNPEGLKILCDNLSEEFNFSDEEIDLVVRKNVKNWLKNAFN